MRQFNPFSAGVLMDPISAIAGGVGLVGNLAGGLIGSSAADKAAKIQQQAAQGAADRVGAAVGQANQPIAEATANAQNLATSGADRVIDTAGQAKAVSDEAAKNANALLDPYNTAGTAAAGTLQGGLAAGGDFNKTPTLADLQMDPGYAFRLQQGETTLNRSAAARGGAVSGETLKALNDYAQGSASQEYQNAFNRYQTDTQSRYNRLFGEQGAGLTAATQQGNNLSTAARYGGDITTDAAKTALGANEYSGTAGLQGATEIANNITGGAKTAADYLTGGANAAAAGKVGEANAWTGALGGGANAVSSALTLSQLLKNPAVRPTVNIGGRP